VALAGALKMVAKTSDEKIAFLIRRRFHDQWRLRIIELSDPRAQALQQFESELKNLPISTLDECYIEAVEDYNREREEAEERADRLESFSQPDAFADFRFWCTLESWSLDETAALLLGKDPRKVSSFGVGHIRHGSPFRRTFEALKSKLNRAHADRKLLERNRPADVVGWAERVAVPVPEQLSAYLETDGGIPIEGRERISMLKLILGMATKHYAYDAGAAKSAVPKQIADDLADFGLKLHPQTIGTYLREATASLPAKANKKELR
jgi:hypothetical protein